VLAVDFRPSDTGFWYKVSAPTGSAYSANFIAIGIAGHQTAGELNGRASTPAEWLHQPVHFPVMHAAVTHFCVEQASVSTEEEAPALSARSVAPSSLPASNG
jgi:hypothetical protein